MSTLALWLLALRHCCSQVGFWHAPSKSQDGRRTSRSRIRTLPSHTSRAAGGLATTSPVPKTPDGSQRQHVRTEGRRLVARPHTCRTHRWRATWSQALCHMGKLQPGRCLARDLRERAVASLDATAKSAGTAPAAGAVRSSRRHHPAVRPMPLRRRIIHTAPLRTDLRALG